MKTLANVLVYLFLIFIFGTAANDYFKVRDVIGSSLCFIEVILFTALVPIEILIKIFDKQKV